ncbi:MAG TPA: SAM-dependent chlorinase/fluorinase [Solirubrobacteraceae bacterium]|nr:SAM-dependent chlorinase/fluorinase [Solirubrobacteraceae bacterium]
MITFLSDYGYEDDFVGVCHAVIAGIAPDVRIIDLAHGLPRHQVRPAALALRNALPYTPSGVHLAVVDPEVGAERRAVALRTAEDERLLVGPDNGLLALATARFGGAVEVVEIGRSKWRLDPVSHTFHGRDIFAPVAAWLAAGWPLAEAGDPLDPAELVGIELPRPRHEEDGTLIAHVLSVDRFGNAALNVSHEDLTESGLRLGHPVLIEAGAGRRRRAHYAVTFADVAPGELLVYEDAWRTLAVAVNRGNAARELALRPDSELRLRAEP